MFFVAFPKKCLVDPPRLAKLQTLGRLLDILYPKTHGFEDIKSIQGSHGCLPSTTSAAAEVLRFHGLCHASAQHPEPPLRRCGPVVATATAPVRPSPRFVGGGEICHDGVAAEKW